MTDSVHPTIDELADLHEGLLDDAADHRLRDHLAVCASCSADFQQLREVEALLATSGSEPTDMPLDVVARIDEALAAEAAGGQPTVSSMAQARAERGAPRRRRPWLQIMAGAAAVLVFAAFGIEGWQSMNSGGGDSDSADSSAGAGADSGAVQEDAPQDVPGKASSDSRFQFTQGARPEVTPDSLATFARQLARANRTGLEISAPSANTSCAAALDQSSSGTVGTVVRWADRRAVVVIDPKARTATVFGCGTGSPELYSTSY